MLLVLCLVGLTIFLASTLLVLFFPSRSTTEARLIEAVLRPEYPEAAAAAHRPGYLDALGIAGGWVRGKIGMEDTSSAARELAQAGYRKPEHVDIYYAAKLLLPAVLALSISFLVNDSTIFWVLAGASLGYFLPDLYLNRQIRARRERIRKGLPDALDLLVICMEAGLGLDQALMRVSTELSMAHVDR